MHPKYTDLIDPESSWYVQIDRVDMHISDSALQLPRYTSSGSVYDRVPPLWFTLLSVYLGQLVPTLFYWLMDKLVRVMSKKEFPNVPESWGFSPAPSIAVCPPLVADELYELMKSGFCEPVSEVTRISGPRAVELETGRLLEDIDAIVYCTGYHQLIPVDMEPQELNPYPYPASPPQLYRHLFSLSPDPAIRNSIAFLGQGAIPYPGFVQHEAQNMCVSQIWQGKSSLPPLSEMKRWHQFYLEWRENMTKQYSATSTFYTGFLPMTDHVDWMDKTAGLGIRKHFGIIERWKNAESWGLWWRDSKLYRKCLNGLTSPALFRLFDEGKRKAWSGAREQIFIDDERVARQQEGRLELLEKQKSV